jgi:hypothetical protein
MCPYPVTPFFHSSTLVANRTETSSYKKAIKTAPATAKPTPIWATLGATAAPVAAALALVEELALVWKPELPLDSAAVLLAEVLAAVAERLLLAKLPEVRVPEPAASTEGTATRVVLGLAGMPSEPETNVAAEAWDVTAVG